MYTRLIAAALIGTALSAPAFAQGSANSQGSQTQSSAQGQSRSQAQVMGQQQLRRQLEQAGFRDVQVLDAAYLVQARTQDGNSVFMMINPPGSGAQGAGMSSGQGSSSGTGATSGASGGSGSSGGGAPSGSGSSSSPSR